MAAVENVREPTLIGALLGWKRMPMGAGAILRIQVTRDLDREMHDSVDEYDVALSATQLRQLGQDLIRAAEEQDRSGPATRRRWWLVWPVRRRRARRAGLQRG
jgi:hypothetical protein